VRIKGLLMCTALTGAALMSTFPAHAADTFPSQDACATTNNNMPSGNCGTFRQMFKENFNGDTVPLGGFSDCNHNVDTPQAYCGGLAAYPEYYANWWAYPTNWDDTAKSGADGNDGAPYGGAYRADKTVSVSPNGYDGTGTMKVDMYRPATGTDNYVAALVPKKCMDQQYGKYSERFRVTRDDGGFKSAHLFYQGGQEIDFPENDYSGEISAYTHPQGGNWSTNEPWFNKTHTASVEWTPNKVKFFLDGKKIGEGATAMPAASWILQNESSIEGPYAARGNHSILETSWVTCYKYDTTLAKKAAKR
jgi:hypothetical protein